MTDQAHFLFIFYTIHFDLMLGITMPPPKKFFPFTAALAAV
jgi:hypothetical protein